MKNAILQLDNAKVLVIGDIMLDAYYEGDATRISPEAPVPVVKIERKRNILGGAGNVARNINALGGKCAIISVVGEDYTATILENLLQQEKIETYLIPDKTRPSTVKSRVFARNQQIIRYDEEIDLPINNTIKQNLLENISYCLKNYPVIVLSDYGKGLLHQELIENIYTIAKKQNLPKPKIFIDPKPQNKAFYHNAFLLTPNHKESAELANTKLKTKEEIIQQGHKLVKDLKSDYLLITLGADGMALFQKNTKEIYHVKSSAKQVFDVTGAGDTVIATLASCLSINLPTKQACDIATLAAGIVVEKVGSATASQEELIQASLTTNIISETW